MKTRYSRELVLQIVGSSLEDYDSLIRVENIISQQIGNLGEVDGHDMGGGEINIFIQTDSPDLLFKKLIRILEKMVESSRMRVAYRTVGGDDFVVLFPSSLESFKIS